MFHTFIFLTCNEVAAHPPEEYMFGAAQILFGAGARQVPPCLIQSKIIVYKPS